MALVEMVEVMETLLREVHEPPSLVDLAVGRVVEEGLGVEELPATLRVKVEQWPSKRREKSEKMRDSMYCPGAQPGTLSLVVFPILQKS